MYNFEEKSGLKVGIFFSQRLALRPEMTPSLARMILKEGLKILGSLPIKWFSIPQCWRYETLTKGRKREHYQWNMV
jgi:histidyl-tRNA synthetase